MARLMYIQVQYGNQERMIVRGGGRASNFARFGDGRNNPPVLFLETRGAILCCCAAEVAIFSTL